MSLSNFNLTVPHKNLYCSDSCSSPSTGLAGSLSSVLFHTQHRWALILLDFVCMCILCAIVYMFKTCHTQKADHLWKVIFPWYQYNFSMNHHHKQVSLMRNSWSDLFLLGLVQVNQLQQNNLFRCYQSHVDIWLSISSRKKAIYLFHPFSQCRTQLCLPSLLSALASQLSHWLEEDRLPLQR